MVAGNLSESKALDPLPERMPYQGVNTMTKFFRDFLRDETGAAAAEYALILAIVGAGIGGAAYLLGQNIDTSISGAAAAVKNCGLNSAGTSTGGTCN